MKSCVENLRRLQTKTGWTPYRIAKEVGLSSARVYQLFDKGGTYDDQTALRVAKLLGEEPIALMASAHAEREKNPEVKAAWEALMEKISKGFEILISCTNPRGIRLPAR